MTSQNLSQDNWNSLQQTEFSNGCISVNFSPACVIKSKVLSRSCIQIPNILCLNLFPHFTVLFQAKLLYSQSSIYIKHLPMSSASLFPLTWMPFPALPLSSIRHSPNAISSRTTSMTFDPEKLCFFWSE